MTTIDPRTYLYVIILVILGGFFTVIAVNIRDPRPSPIEKATVASEMRKLANIEALIERREVEKRTVQRQLLSLKNEDYKNLDFSREIESLKDRIAENQARNAELTEERDALVAKARTASVNKNLGTLRLRTGDILNDVHIQRIDDTAISVRHSAGVRTLDIETLPQDWVERFGILETPKVAASEPDFLNTGDISPPFSEVPMLDSSGSAFPAVPTAALQREIDLLQTKVTNMEKRLAFLYSEADRLTQEAQMSRAEHEKARAAGKSSAHSARAKQLEAAAGRIRNEAAVLRVTIQKAREEISAKWKQ